MPLHTIILTTGVSVFGDRNLAGAALRVEGSPVPFGERAFSPDLSGVTEKGEEDFLRETFSFLKSRLEGEEVDPARSSAECAVVCSMLREGKLAAGSMAVLIHLPSLRDRLAAVCLQVLLEKLGLSVSCDPLSVPFDPGEPGGLAYASGAFIAKLTSALGSYPRETTAFAPIGGFKVMASLGYLAASIKGYSCLYQHEESRVLQTISPAPIQLSAPEDLAVLVPVARKVGGAAAWDDLSEDEQAVVESNPLYFHREEGLIALNELGYYFRLSQTPVRISRQVKEMMVKAGSELPRRHLCQLRDLATQNQAHGSLNKKIAGSKSFRPQWQLAGMGDGHRLAWKWRDDEILVHHLWMDHDDYDRNDGVMWKILEGELPTENSDFELCPLDGRK